MSTLDPTIAPVAPPAGRPAGAAEPAVAVQPVANATAGGGNAQTPRGPASAIALAATLSGLLEGTLLEALSMGKDRDTGATLLKTSAGTFLAQPRDAAQAPPALPANARAVLQVLAIGDAVQAALISVDGEPAAAPLLLTLRLVALAPRLPTPDATTAPTVPRPGEEGSPTPASHTGPPPATRVVPPAPAALAPLHAGQSVLGVVRSSQSALPAALPPGSLVGLKIIALTAPDAPPPSPSPGALLATVEVEGDRAPLRAVLRLPGGTLRLPGIAPPAAGSRVLLEVAGAAPAPQAAREPDAERLVAELQATVATLADDPAASMRANERWPAPGRKFTAMALLFLNAVRQGDLGGWLAEALPRPATKTDDASPLRHLAGGWRDFAGESDGNHAAAEGWRPWLLPFHDGIALRPLMFQLRRRSSRSQQRDADETRFLLDLDLSALGPLQFDGLIRPRRFDLILRGAARLDAVMRRELQLLFQDNLGACGYVGQLSFQEPRPPARGQSPRTVAQA